MINKTHYKQVQTADLKQQGTSTTLTAFTTSSYVQGCRQQVHITSLRHLPQGIPDIAADLVLMYGVKPQATYLNWFQSGQLLIF